MTDETDEEQIDFHLRYAETQLESIHVQVRILIIHVSTSFAHSAVMKEEHAIFCHFQADHLTELDKVHAVW